MVRTPTPTSLDERSLSATELLSSCDEAIEKALSHLRENTLPSFWNPVVRGWKELWNSSFAGFYAPCDGVILFRSLPRNHKPPPGEREFLHLLFFKHIRRVVDTSRPTISDQQHVMREETLNTTMKLAKFVQAALHLLGTHSRRDSLVKAALECLVAEGSAKDGYWRACPVSNSPISLSATAEALRAIHLWKDPKYAPLVERGIGHLSDVVRHETDLNRRVLAAWALTHMLDLPSAPQTSYLLDFARECLSDRFPWGAVHREEFTNNFDRVDFYTFNLGSLLASTVAVLIAHSALSSAWIRQLLGFIVSVLCDLLRDGRVSAHRYGRHDTFWENAQVLEAVGTLRRAVAASLTQLGGSFMYVQPVHFHRTSFALDDKLTVVLMPLGPRWANDVFEVFRTAARASRFNTWRSDLVHKDDPIMQTIWEKINESRFIIADCTGKNPNVFYELGIAHVIGKPVFICAQSRKDLPFDISHVRSFVYGTLPGELDKLQNEIRSFIKELA